MLYASCSAWRAFVVALVKRNKFKQAKKNLNMEPNAHCDLLNLFPVPVYTGVYSGVGESWSVWLWDMPDCCWPTFLTPKHYTNTYTTTCSTVVLQFFCIYLQVKLINSPPNEEKLWLSIFVCNWTFPFLWCVRALDNTVGGILGASKILFAESKK